MKKFLSGLSIISMCSVLTFFASTTLSYANDDADQYEMLTAQVQVKHNLYVQREQAMSAIIQTAKDEYYELKDIVSSKQSSSQIFDAENYLPDEFLTCARSTLLTYFLDVIYELDTELATIDIYMDWTIPGHRTDAVVKDSNGDEAGAIAELEAASELYDAIMQIYTEIEALINVKDELLGDVESCLAEVLPERCQPVSSSSSEDSSSTTEGSSSNQNSSSTTEGSSSSEDSSSTTEGSSSSYDDSSSSWY